ncbi:MAG: lysylphosphatidylglycerol synthase domain-containing protein, partial [Solirubrobacteraceae bacterium]
MGRRLLLPGVIASATIAGFVVVSLKVSGGALQHAAHPNWALLATAFVVVALAQPLRAMAWKTTLRSAVDFKAVYAASAVGSFLDTVLPARLGEASKVGVLRVSAGRRWPGLPRAAGSLLCAHLLEAIAFLLVGAAAAAFLPFPDWARWTMVGGFAIAAGAIGVAALLHRSLGHRLPRRIDGFLSEASASPRVLAHAGGILLATWI